MVDEKEDDGKVIVRFPKGKVNNYLKQNWGAPFILCFMMLLFISALSLLYNLQDIANGIVIWAYYSLVVGVALQLISHLKYMPKEEND